MHSKPLAAKKISCRGQPGETNMGCRNGRDRNTPTPYLFSANQAIKRFSKNSLFHPIPSVQRNPTTTMNAFVLLAYLSNPSSRSSPSNDFLHLCVLYRLILTYIVIKGRKRNNTKQQTEASQSPIHLDPLGNARVRLQKTL